MLEISFNSGYGGPREFGRILKILLYSEYKKLNSHLPTHTFITFHDPNIENLSKYKSISGPDD